MIPVESIERIIDDLETKRDACLRACTLIPEIVSYSAAKAYDYAISELRKVLMDYGPGKS